MWYGTFKGYNGKGVIKKQPRSFDLGLDYFGAPNEDKSEPSTSARVIVLEPSL